MGERIRHHIRSNVVGYVALFFALSTGSAVALAGSNTVFSDDIVNGEVKTPDVANGAVKNARLGDNAVNSPKVLDNSLTGVDIDESSLAKVPNADQLDGIDSSQLEGARAYALSGGTYCPGNPVVFCSIPRNKGIGYIVKVAEGRYCVGVDGISAADPKSVAVVSVANSASSDTSTTWLTSNVGCVAREFEVLVGFGTTLNSGYQFTIVIP